MKIFRFSQHIIASILLLGLFEYSNPAPASPSVAQFFLKRAPTSTADLLSQAQARRPAYKDTRSSVEIFLDNGTISPSTGGFWRQPIPSTVQYEPAHLDAAGTLFDVNYSVITSNSDPLTDVYVPASWQRRSGGTQWLEQVHFPVSFVLPDAGQNNTPNNPLCTVNRDTKKNQCFNSAARPTVSSPLYAYNAGSHGGSGLSGGDITGAALRQGQIKHAIGILVWARKFLSFQNGGFTAPAVRADDYANTESYGGQNQSLVMGSRLALKLDDTPKKLGVSCPTLFPVIQAFKQYGAYVVDDSAWNVFYLSTDAEAAKMLEPCREDLLKIYRALQVVTNPN